MRSRTCCNKDELSKPMLLIFCGKWQATSHGHWCLFCATSPALGHVGCPVLHPLQARHEIHTGQSLNPRPPLALINTGCPSGPMDPHIQTWPLFVFFYKQAAQLDPWSLSHHHIFRNISAIGMCALTHFQQSAACRVLLHSKPGTSPQGAPEVQLLLLALHKAGVMV